MRQKNENIAYVFRRSLRGQKKKFQAEIRESVKFGIGSQEEPEK